MVNLLTVTPAYGRDYKSAKDARGDWDSGKDFYAQGLTFQGYLSSRDSEALKKDGYTGIMIRYGNLRKGTLFDL